MPVATGPYRLNGNKLTVRFAPVGESKRSTAACVCSFQVRPDGKLHLDDTGPGDACQMLHGVSWGWVDGMDYVRNPQAETRLAAAPAAPAATAGPSFDCARATARADRLVCADPQLSAMDRKIVAAYQSALQHAGNPTAADPIRHAQIVWVRAKMRCSTTACLQHLYTQRLAALGAR